MNRSYYSSSFSEFISEDNNSILGKLSQANQFDLSEQQRNAWVIQIIALKSILPKLNFCGKIYFEFSIPRMGKRVDAIIASTKAIFVIEFKVFEKEYPKHALEQVYDYCIDLQNFHEGSHKILLVPILICTNAPIVSNTKVITQQIIETQKSNSDSAVNIINEIYEKFSLANIDITKWEQSNFKPTPTIIEASQALYRGHNVSEITRSEAGAINIDLTTKTIDKIIDDAKKNNDKVIFFITGVPGAGKTLAGLNIANERRKYDENEHAVFLSGNGPLVAVLREALIREDMHQNKRGGRKLSETKAKAFIQNIHHFRDDNIISTRAPIERVVVFDEAQRAWDQEMATRFMKKKGIDFEYSEPEFLIRVMDRHVGYACIICLIGGGQEINTGEAGLSEWIKALESIDNGWRIYYSPQIVSDKLYLKNLNSVFYLRSKGISVNEFHLNVSIRSFRAESTSNFIKAILEMSHVSSKQIASKLQGVYDLFITRDLRSAKLWLQQKARGSERIGILASSGARRLKAFGIDVKNDFSPEYWFLNSKTDIRSSNFMEIIATEYDIQGLELDYCCVAWDINLVPDEGKWLFRMFRGTSWGSINSEEERSYLVNAYRVLLTRARQGLIIYVPTGNDEDETTPTYLYDRIFSYLVRGGFQVI